MGVIDIDMKKSLSTLRVNLIIFSVYINAMGHGRFNLVEFSMSLQFLVPNC